MMKEAYAQSIECETSSLYSTYDSSLFIIIVRNWLKGNGKWQSLPFLLEEIWQEREE